MCAKFSTWPISRATLLNAMPFRTTWLGLLVITLIGWYSCCLGDPVACKVQLVGSKTGLRDARIACSGSTVVVDGDPDLLQPFQHQFDGVQWDPGACGNTTAGRCLLSFCGSTRALLLNSSVLGVHAPQLDAVVCFSGSSGVAWHRANITGNTAGRHGAVLVTDAAQASFLDSEIANNTAASAKVASGGGFAVLADGRLALSNCSITGNSAQGGELGVGGAVFLDHHTVVTIHNCSLSLNAAVRSTNAALSGGGALCSHGSAVIRISSSSLIENRASGPAGHPSGMGSWQLFLISIDRNSLFTFNAASHGFAAGGGALLIFGTSSLTMQDCVLQQNMAVGSVHSAGGALALLENATASLLRCSFVRNTAAHAGSSGLAVGGALSGTNSTTVTIIDSSFEGNLVYGNNCYGGAICASQRCNVTMINSRVVNNTSDNTIAEENPGDAPGWGRAGGAGVGLNDFATVQLEGCWFQGNYINGNMLGNGGGAGVMAAVRGRVSARNCTFIDNGLHGGNEGGGGGIGCCHHSLAMVDNCTFIRNSAKCLGGCTGGGVHAHDHATTIVRNSVFINNTAEPLEAGGGPVREGMGGGIGAEINGTLVVSGCSFTGNTAAGYQGLGGGVFVGGSSTGRVTNCSFIGNHASFGGGIASQGSGKVNVTDCLITEHYTPGSGAGVMLSGISQVIIKNTVITHNRAGEGGGVYAHSPGSPYLLRLLNSSITHNNAMSGGGCMFKGGNVRIGPGCSISSNVAHQQGGGFAWLSGCWNARECPSLVDVSCEAAIEFNAAAVAGGGAFLGDSSMEHEFRLSELCMQRAAHNNSAAFGDVDVFYVRHDCKVGEVSKGGWCDVCPPNMFSFDEGSGAFCHICPSNSHCPGGDKLYPMLGYWHSHNFSTQVHRCPNERACDRSSVFDTSSSSSSGSGRSSGSMDWQCATGYTGILCGSCVEGWGQKSPFFCGRCLSPLQTFMVYLVALLCILVLLTVVSQSIWTDNQSQFFGELHVSDVLKLVLLYIQYVWVMGSTPMDWPRPLSGVFWGVSWLFATCTNRVISLDCLLSSYAPTAAVPMPIQRIIVHLLNPVLVFVAVLAVFSLFWCVHVLQRRMCFCSGKHVPYTAWLLPRASVVLLVVVFFFYPSLVRDSLSLFACFKVDAAGQQPYPQYAVADAKFGYLVSDMQQPCWQGWHKTYALAIGIPLTTLFCAGFPAAVLLLLVMYNNGAWCMHSFQQKFGFLYRTFRPERYYWEAILAVQTVLLVCISVFAHIVGPYYELILFAVVFSGSLVVHLWLQPFAFVQLHRMQLAGTACLALTSFAGLTFLGDVSHPKTPSPAMPYFPVVVSSLVLALNSVFFLLSVAFTAKIAWHGIILRRALRSRKRSYRDAEVCMCSTNCATKGSQHQDAVANMSVAADATCAAPAAPYPPLAGVTAAAAAVPLTSNLN